MSPDSKEFAASWTSLALEAGSPFHSAEFCSVVQRHWPGADQPRHVARHDRELCQGITPAYLYGRCPRLDYYRRNVAPALDGRMIGAHALVGWYGGPIARDDLAMKAMLQDHLDLCRQDEAMSFFFGIDGRDRRTLQHLADAGYSIGRLQTNVVRQISSDDVRDPLMRLKKPERPERRRVMRRAEEAGLELRIVRPSEAVSHVELIRSAVRRLNTEDDVLPAAFVRAVLEADLPGLEVLVAVTPDGRAAAADLNFVWRDAYYLWLGGNERELVKPYYPSDFLYQHSIRRAAHLGLREIQGGRSPYAIKMAYGFECIPIMCAIHPLSFGDPSVITAWLAAQEARHLALYPEISV